MVQKLVCDIVQEKIATGAFPVTAYTAVDVLSHYIINDSTDARNGKWSYVKSSRYEISLLGTNLLNHEIYITLEKIVFQPSNRGLDEVVENSALVYAIVYAAAIRTAKQKDIDNSEHIGRIISSIGIVFMALNIVAGASPVTALGSIVGSITSTIQSAVAQHMKNTYPSGVFKGCTDDLMEQTVKMPANEGLRVPGLRTVDNSPKKISLRQPYGERFVTDLENYFQYLNTKEPRAMTKA